MTVLTDLNAEHAAQDAQGFCVILIKSSESKSEQTVVKS